MVVFFQALERRFGGEWAVSIGPEPLRSRFYSSEVASFLLADPASQRFQDAGKLRLFAHPTLRIKPFAAVSPRRVVFNPEGAATHQRWKSAFALALEDVSENARA